MPAVPIPPGFCKALFYLSCQCRVWRISKLCLAWRSGICQPQGHLQAFDTHMVSYPNLTIKTWRILLESQAEWQIGLSVKERKNL